MDETYSNFMTIQFMLVEATKLLRKIFLESWKDMRDVDWGDDEESGKYFKTTVGREIFDKCKKIQQICLRNGNTVEWDITLLGTILTSTPFQSFFKKKSKIQWINKISEVRNKINHSPSMILSESELKDLSESLGKAMINLGMSEHVVKKLIENKGFKMADHADFNKDATKIKELANEEFRNKNYANAIEKYTSALMISNLTNQEVGILYCNRSLANLKLYDETQNERNLSCALFDAKQTCFYYPVWYKGYARLGEVYYIMEELEKSKENYEKALAFSPNNKDLSNLLADIKRKISERQRYEHLNSQYSSVLTTEDRSQEFYKKFIEKKVFNNTGIDQVKERFEFVQKKLLLIDPTLKDVWKGHEYRDGSATVGKNYEIAAQYYNKAAKNGNPEGMYNLALLTRKGLGVKRDYESAIILLKEAAQQPATRTIGTIEIPVVGVAEAEHSLGLAYQEGIYVMKNLMTAAFWYEKAVEHGNANAANNLGLLYLEGNGVKKCIQQAEKLFIIAHEKGDINASGNLVELYIHIRDPERALMWHERALEIDPLYNKLKDRETREAIKSIQSFKDLYNITHKKNTLSYENFVDMLMLDSKKTVKSPLSPKQCIYDRNEIFKYAQNGSKTASIIVDALDHFHYALYMLSCIDDFNVSEFFKNFALAIMNAQYVCQIPRNMYEKIAEIIKNTLQENKNKKCDIDYNARICFVHVHGGDVSLVINFLTSSLQMYPNDFKMLEFRGCFYGFQQQYEKALEDYEQILSLNSEDYENIYYKAVALRFLTEGSEAIKFYEQFISKAPHDHRKIPESYYALASLYLEHYTDKNHGFEKVLYFYKKGLESEKNQLPCFLPYESSIKPLLAHIEAFHDNKIQKNLSDIKPFLSEVPVCSLQNDHKRIELIKKHRKSIKDLRDEKVQYSTSNTYTPNKEQRLPNSLAGLKMVFLRDIDFTKDHILDGCILTVTNFDVPIIGQFTSAHFIIEDEYKFVQRLCIYNLGNDFDGIQSKFPIGCIFSIVNPYIRLAIDGLPMIRVDDPNSVIFFGKNKNNMCRYCGKENSNYTCNRCKIAKYCSKDCQSYDWKILNHKHVCFN